VNQHGGASEEDGAEAVPITSCENEREERECHLYWLEKAAKARQESFILAGRVRACLELRQANCGLRISPSFLTGLREERSDRHAEASSGQHGMDGEGEADIADREGHYEDVSGVHSAVAEEHGNDNQ